MKDLAAVLAEITGSLTKARAGLDELRSAQAASDAQAGLLRDIATRLRRMLDAGELDIALRSGRMVLVLPADVRFEAGKSDSRRGLRIELAALVGTRPSRSSTS